MSDDPNIPEKPESVARGPQEPSEADPGQQAHPKKLRKDTRFQPGRSPNPSGRPRKAVRADVPVQLLEDLRAATHKVYPGPHNPEGLPAGELIVRNLVLGAIAGKPTALRKYFELLPVALADNVAKDPILSLLDGTDPILLNTDEKFRAGLHKALAERSKKPRRMR